MIRSKVLLLLFIILASSICDVLTKNPHGADVDDNDFAEFEEFDEDDTGKKEKPVKEKPATEQTQPNEEEKVDQVESDETDQQADANDGDGEVTIEEEDEFDHLNDDEEFEGFDKETPAKSSKKEAAPDLKITKIPLHLRTNWDSFHCEMLMLVGLAVYFVNFVIGKTKNSKLAEAWFNKHKDYLEKHFHLVGDNGENKEIVSSGLNKESEHQYSLWCSGRVCCEGMLVQLKLLKRQDIINMITRIFKPSYDQILVKVTMDASEMDTFVMCIANKKLCSKLQKDMTDLNQYCPEIKKSPEKYGLPPSYQLLSEIGDATTAILDRTVTEVFRKYENQIEYIHFSDQFSGAKTQDEDVPKKPETEKVLLFCFNIGNKGNTGVDDMVNSFGLLQLVIYCIDKVHRLRLSKEAKSKADKNRQKVDSFYSKLTHAQRQEAAQLRREEKQRNEKERMMNEDDPDRQRKLEDLLAKKEAKKKGPKMKMMKVKSM